MPGKAPTIIPSTQAPNVLFMSSIFDETMNLLSDAHEYFQNFGKDDQERIDPSLRSLYSCEMSRITLRLSSIMAWIMVQRSILNGKITPDQTEHFHLDFQDICSVDNRMLHGVLPSYVCFLLDRTLELYERVMRLDGQSKRLH